MENPERTLVIGRSPFADVVIADPSVAPHHAEIVVTSAGRLHLTDCGTPGGTWRLARREDTQAAPEWLPVRQAFVREDEPLRLGDHDCRAGELVRLARGRTSAAERVPGVAEEPGGSGRRALRGRVERDAVTGEIVRRRP